MGYCELLIDRHASLRVDRSDTDDVREMTASHGDEVPVGQLQGTSSLSQSSDTGDKDDKIPQSPTIRQDQIEDKPMTNGVNAKIGDGGRPTSPQTAGTASSDVVRKRIAAIDDENGNKATKQPSKKEKPALRKGKWTVRTNLMGFSTKISSIDNSASFLFAYRWKKKSILHESFNTSVQACLLYQMVQRCDRT